MPHSRGPVPDTEKFSDVVDEINESVWNHQTPGETVIEANDDEPDRRLFKLRHENIEPGSLSLLSGGVQLVEGTHYTLYPRRGWIRFLSQPSGTYTAYYNYRPYSDDSLVMAINSGISAVCTYFPVTGITQITVSSGVQEYELPVDAYYIEHVELQEEDGRFRKFTSWRIEDVGGAMYLHLLYDVDGIMKIRYYKRPLQLADSSDFDDTLLSHNIAPAAAHPLAMYGAWFLIRQALNRRMSEPTFMNADEPNVPTVRDMQFQMQYLWDAYQQALLAARRTPKIVRL